MPNACVYVAADARVSCVDNSFSQKRHRRAWRARPRVPASIFLPLPCPKTLLAYLRGHFARVERTARRPDPRSARPSWLPRCRRIEHELYAAPFSGRARHERAPRNPRAHRDRTTRHRCVTRLVTLAPLACPDAYLRNKTYLNVTNVRIASQCQVAVIRVQKGLQP